MKQTSAHTMCNGSVYSEKYREINIVVEDKKTIKKIKTPKVRVEDNIINIRRAQVLIGKT